MKKYRLKNVTFNELFPGHFRENPSAQVLIIESMAQVGGLLAYKSLPESREINFYGHGQGEIPQTGVPGIGHFRIDGLAQRAEVWKMRSPGQGTLVAEAN
jgi:3-hydroxymyristoyl/3-hydroxydecanoyl-(acyl carrier protein) dehydratase